MKWTALVTLAALALYLAISLRTGLVRGRTGVIAPATTGHPDFERAYRVQQNTLEWLPLFLACLWLSAFFVSDRFAALVGLVWIVGRALYWQSYTVDAAKRGPGFLVQLVATLILFCGALAGVVHVILM